MALPLVSPEAGEAAVVGLGKSGVAAAKLLRARGYAVYASDDNPNIAATRDVLEGAGVTVQLGGHDLDRIARAAFVVASPGVPPDAAPLVRARDARREVLSEIELALRLTPALAYIAVTGTNGKTTTTALIGHLLRALGVNAPDAGNIGTPLSDVVAQPVLPDWISLELSSFQLHDTPSVDPAVGVLTNLSADHLDRYASVDEYFADKAMLFANANPASRWVLNADDPASLEIARGVPGEQRFFSVREGADAWYDRGRGELDVLGAPLVSRDALALLGDHNVANALAASLAVMLASESFRTAPARATIAGALATFRALAHRLELVGEWSGVQWINDSKATNVGSTYVAVAGMTRPTILLLGGRHKGEPYTSLANEVRAHVKHVVAFGEAGPIVAEDLAGVVPLDLVTGDFEAVMAHARSLASPGDAVLLSPACSSYDMFNNYIERGERFRALAGQG